MVPQTLQRRRKDALGGFTLTELLVLTVLVGMLSGLIFSARANARPKPGLIECRNNLRQIGLAIELYAADNGKTLPGPTWSGVFPDYKNTWSDRLGYYLWPYLGTPAPSSTRREIPTLKCPAGMEAAPSISLGSDPQGIAQPVYFLSSVVITNRTPSSELVQYPFGRPSAPLALPIKLTSIKRPSEQWAICDADQKNVPSGTTYFNYLPADAVHGSRPGGSRSNAIMRNYLFFDGSVRTLQTPQ